MTALQDATAQELRERAKERELIRDGALAMGDEDTARAAERMRRMYLARVEQMRRGSVAQQSNGNAFQCIVKAK